MSAPALDRFDAWMAALPDAERRALGLAYAGAARRGGVFVVKADGSEVAIPPLLSPVAVDPARLAQVSSDARHLLSALVRLTRAIMEGDDPAARRTRARLFGSFAPLEAEGLAKSWRSAAHLTTARVDFLVDDTGAPRALEMNATIPAMQGYSDGVAEAFVREVARARGLSEQRASALVDANGRNTDDLLESLIAHHQRLGGRAGALTIAIVARAGDAQRGELEHYVSRWSELGHRVSLATPEQISIENGRARAGELQPDLLYRHVFARRLDPAGAFARMCLDPDRFHIFNPLASHLEVKAMLGLLSRAVDEGGEADRLGLPPDEQAAVRRAVPWTRVLEPGRATGPSGEPIADLPSWVRAERARLVLKRSWDYGGRSVFLGADFEEPTAQERFRSLFGLARETGAADFGALVDRALADQDAWVVQALVSTPRVPCWRVEPNGVRRCPLYLDLSAYTNLGVAPSPAGGAVRASESRIVNILGGGGLAPLVRTPVLDALFSDGIS